MIDRDAPPTVRSQAPQGANPSKDLIPITASPKGAIPAQAKRDPMSFWAEYYRKNDEVPAALKFKLMELNRFKKFEEVRAILFNYLKFHSKNSEPWMYEAYALALKMNHAKDSDVKTALGYAADLALKSRNPNFLVSVADQMILLNDLDRVGPLLDQAADLIPHRGEPLLMSINLALKTRDPKRMGDTIDRLLALGWPASAPGFDDTIRRDARKQAESLAKTLREEGRNTEADALLARLPEAEARDLFIRLTWLGDAGLDLVVNEPLGATSKAILPRTAFGGSVLRDGYGKHAEEVYVCPRAFDGVYTIRVETTYNNPEKPALSATLEIITHEGTPEEHTETRTIKLGGKAGPEPVKITLKGGRRKQVLPLLLPTSPSAPPSAPAVVARPSEKGQKAAETSSPRPSVPAQTTTGRTGVR